MQKVSLQGTEGPRNPLDQIVESIPQKPYCQDSSGVIYCGDCLTIMKHIPNGAVDLVVTDPPYGIDKADWDSNYPVGFEPDCFRVATTVVIMPGQWALPLCLAAMGENYRGVIAGRNKNGMTFSPLGFGNWIPAVVGGAPIGSGPDAFDFVIKAVKNDHPSPKPIEFMLKLANRVSSPGDIILDPFCGSGTTCVAAKQLGRKYIGIEIKPDYCKIAEDRLRQGELFGVGAV